MNKILLFLVIAIGLSACSEYTPKPGAYPRIDKITGTSKEFDFPKFSFNYSDIVEIQELKKDLKGELWFNISYPAYHVTVYCTYIQVDEKSLSQALEVSYQLAYNHVGKSESIAQTLYTDSLHSKSGIIYDVKGPVATPVQFYITDDKSNFLRGSLYFNQEIKIDSVAPVIQYVREDIIGLMESLRWK